MKNAIHLFILLFTTISLQSQMTPTLNFVVHNNLKEGKPLPVVSDEKLPKELANEKIFYIPFSEEDYKNEKWPLFDPHDYLNREIIKMFGEYPFEYKIFTREDMRYNNAYFLDLGYRYRLKVYAKFYSVTYNPYHSDTEGFIVRLYDLKEDAYFYARPKYEHQSTAVHRFFKDAKKIKKK